MTEEELRVKILGIIHDSDVDITVGEDLHKLTTDIAATAIEHFKTVHSKALAAHCECLGMNAENCIAACVDATPPYKDAHYYKTMQKWGLIDKKGEPTISPAGYTFHTNDSCVLKGSRKQLTMRRNYVEETNVNVVNNFSTIHNADRG